MSDETPAVELIDGKIVIQRVTPAVRRLLRAAHEIRKAATMKTEITESSGNVFADIGCEHPEEELAKADLAIDRATARRDGYFSRLFGYADEDNPEGDRF